MKTPDTHCPLDLSKWRITLINAQNKILSDSFVPDEDGPVVWDDLLLAALRWSNDIVEMRVEPLHDASTDASLDSNAVTVIRGLEGILTYLLDSGAQVNAITEKEDGTWTPLLAAICSQNMPSLKFLLDRGADVNQVVGGITPLLRATYWQDGQMVKLLLGHGADVKFADNKGLTALMRVAESARFDIMDLLLGAGADMDAVNLDGQSARQIATQAYLSHWRFQDDFYQYMNNVGHFSSGAAVGVELCAKGYWTAPCGDRYRMSLWNDQCSMAHEFVNHLPMLEEATVNRWMDLSRHLKWTVNVLDWKMIDLLREFGADIDAPADTGITWRELAVDALENQLTRQLEENEGIPAVIQHAILQAIEQVKHEPIQGTVPAAIAAIDSAVCLAIKTALPEAIAAAINARIETPHAVAVDGLLKKQLAFALWNSHTELEATLALIVRHLESPLAPSAWSSSIIETGSFSSSVITTTLNVRHLNVNVCGDDRLLVKVPVYLHDWNIDSAYSQSQGTSDHAVTHGLVEALVDDDSNIAVPEYLGLPAGEPML